MSAKLAIYLPTYKRPRVLADVAKNIEENTYSDYVLYFGLEPDDREGILAAKDTGHKVVINEGEQGYSDTIQTIYEQSNEPFFFHANDDFVFLKDWDKAPIEMLEANPDLMVVGCHDGNPKTNFWTISMVRRSYIEDQSGVVDIPNRVFYPYGHNYIDTEFSETAIRRGVWENCAAKCIEHHHPSLVHLYNEPEKTDETYQKNLATFGKDSETYNSRRHLWS